MRFLLFPVTIFFFPLFLAQSGGLMVEAFASVENVKTPVFFYTWAIQMKFGLVTRTVQPHRRRESCERRVRSLSTIVTSI